MSPRHIASAAALASALAVAALAPVSISGQAGVAKAAATSGTKADAAPGKDDKKPSKPWVQPKTAWGDPDLQGIYTYSTLTPLERPAWVGDRESFTDEEMRKLVADKNDDNAPRRPGDVGTYNTAYFEWGVPERRTSLIVDPANGKRPPMTAEGRRRAADRQAHQREHPADSWEDLSLWVRCIAYHGVPAIPSGYNNDYQIFQTPTLIVMYDESTTGARRIWMDGRGHPDKSVKLWNGHSVGHWEGNTLVVETTNFTEIPNNRVAITTPTGKLIERFTRVAEDRIENRLTIDEPEIYTQPWTAVMPYKKIEGPIYEYACHEGNVSLPAILKGARMDEAAGKKRPLLGGGAEQ